MSSSVRRYVQGELFGTKLEMGTGLQPLTQFDIHEFQATILLRATSKITDRETVTSLGTRIMHSYARARLWQRSR